MPVTVLSALQELSHLTLQQPYWEGNTIIPTLMKLSFFVKLHTQVLAIKWLGQDLNLCVLSSPSSSCLLNGIE